MKNFKTIILRLEDRELELNICEEDQTVWMTQKKISSLFNISNFYVFKLIKFELQNLSKKGRVIFQFVKKR